MLWMAYGYCHMPGHVCGFRKFPMISVVINEPMYRCVFIYMTSSVMFGLFQTNMRAYYKKCQGVIDPGLNNFLLVIGYASGFIMPLIGLFDRAIWGVTHIVCAFFFILFFGVYLITLTRTMHDNREKFPISEERNIQLFYYHSCAIAFVLSSFGICYSIYGEDFISPFMQWGLFFYMTNFWGILNLNNEYVSTIE